MSIEPAARGARRAAVRMTDSELLAALRAGDPSAFPEICARHEPALRRMARRILQSNPAIVDDVIQESLLRGHRALRRDDRHIEIRPYLFRLVRNCCLDEIARVRTDSVALHLLHAGDEPAGHDSAHALYERRDRFATTIADLAGLPENQRHALLRREIDGLTHEQVAAELGVSAGASRSLVVRARETLTRAAAARGADCQDVRAELLRAHDARRRAPSATLRHVAGCADCRAFRAALKDDRRTLRALAPVPLLLGGALLGGKLTGALVGASKPAGVKAAAVAAVAVSAAGGVYALRTQVFGPGDRAPIAAGGVALPGGTLAAGQRIPAHVALVTKEVALPRTGAVPAVSVSCPADMRVAGLVPDARDGRSHGFAASTVIGASSTARVLFARQGPGAGRTVTVAIVCREPSAGGSVRAAPVAPAGMATVHACRRRTALSHRPRGPAVGTVTAHQPLAVLGSRDGWLRVRTDAGRTGWVREQVAC
jgi:RNA polymerase sigma factor (sigma-70 family)